MSRDPFFRLNFNFEIPRPAPTAIAQDEETTDNVDNDIETEHREHEGVVLIPRKSDKKGWLRTAREHPRFSLRLTAIIALVIGLSFNGFVVDNYYDWRVDSLTSPAVVPLCISLIYQLADLYHERLFRRKMPTWIIVCLEVLGFIAFTALFVLAQIAINQKRSEGLDGYDFEESIMLAYDSVPWLIASMIHLIVLIQVVSGSIRDRRKTKRRCVDCGSKVQANSKGKGKKTSEGDEEALLGEGGEAEPSSYRDDEAVGSS